MADPTSTREQKLADFVTWTTAHITGDEKGQARSYIGRLPRVSALFSSDTSPLERLAGSG